RHRGRRHQRNRHYRSGGRQKVPQKTAPIVTDMDKDVFDQFLLLIARHSIASDTAPLPLLPATLIGRTSVSTVTVLSPSPAMSRAKRNSLTCCGACENDPWFFALAF